VRPAALRQRLVDLNLACMSDLPFWFFETADLPPEQDFLQGQETDRASVLSERCNRRASIQTTSGKASG
jgi:hypothetical protein